MLDRQTAQRSGETSGTTALRRVLFVVDPARLWRWQVELVSEFAGDNGYRVAVAKAPESRSLPRGLTTLFAFERLVYGQRSSSADITDLAALAAPIVTMRPGEHDVVVDFAGIDLASALGDMPALILLYDGVADDTAAIAAIVDGRRPRLTLAGCDDSGLGDALPAVEEPRILSQALEPVFATGAELVRRALREGTICAGTDWQVTPQQVTLARRPLTFGLQALVAKIGARLDRHVRTAPRWAIGWRPVVAGDTIADRLAMPDARYFRLPDDGRRYFADPFVIVRDGRRYVFCEEYPYATGKGVISVFTIEADGRVTSPRVVLERPYHLSYPFVFERGGEVFMIPETLGNRAIELYRAVTFPDRWEKVATLVDGVEASDATLLERDGRLWLFAAISDGGRSTWDGLGLFHADDLFGEWRALPANPVLADAGAARPGGEMFVRDGALYRPAQDCREFYGGGLAIARVDRLDLDGYAQTVVARIKPDPRRADVGMHTVNTGGGIEVIDIFGDFAWRQD